MSPSGENVLAGEKNAHSQLFQNTYGKGVNLFVGHLLPGPAMRGHWPKRVLLLRRPPGNGKA